MVTAVLFQAASEYGAVNLFREAVRVGVNFTSEYALWLLAGAVVVVVIWRYLSR
jgi:hypothetical protein